MASSTTQLTTTAPSIRLHGLDALRGGALLLGIVLHSLLPFVPGLPWLVVDSQTTWLAGIPVYVIHLFRMALFMLLAGYFGRMVINRRGPAAYLRDRVLRILLPLIIFWPFAVLTLGVLAIANAERQGLPLPPESSSEPANLLLSINPGQLWFLVVLMQCAVIMVVVRALAILVFGRERCGRWSASVGRMMASPGGLLLAAVPYASALLLQGSVLGSIIAPMTVLPEATPLIAYLGAFVVGWMLHARSDALSTIARRWKVYLTVAVISTIIGFVVTEPNSTVPLPVLAALTAVAAWSWVYALLGVCVRFLHTERLWIRYLADASYWMYLIHLPLLVGLEVLLVSLNWPIAIKLTLTWVVVGAVLLVSYHLLVRSTPIGRWLNGRRYRFRLPFTRAAEARRMR